MQLVHARIPDMFTSPEPEKVLIRMVLGAISQYDYTMTVRKLAHGRMCKMKTTERRNLKGVKKVEGRHNFLELRPQIVRVLSQKLPRPFAKLKTKSGAVLSLGHLSMYLKQNGIATKPRTSIKGNKSLGGEPINTGRLLHWLHALDKLKK